MWLIEGQDTPCILVVVPDSGASAALPFYAVALTYLSGREDAFANEAILDMQGITEAVSRYYYANGESFEGLSVAPEYQDRFEQLAEDARHYYES